MLEDDQEPKLTPEGAVPGALAGTQSDITTATLPTDGDPASHAALAGALGRRGLRLPLLSRRQVLVAGGGMVVVVAAGTVVAYEKHLISHLRNLALRLKHGSEPALTPHPHALPDGPMSTPRDIIVFDGALSPGWQNRSWGTYSLGDASASYARKPGISMQVANWSGLQLASDLIDTTGLGYLQCWVRGADRGGQLVTVALIADGGIFLGGNTLLGDYTQGGSIALGEWRLARVPLSALGADYALLRALVFQAHGQQDQGTIQVADLRFVYHPDLRPPTVARITSYDLYTLTVVFRVPMDAASAARTSAYLLAGAAETNDPAYPTAHPVAPMAVRYHPTAWSASLTLAQPLRAGQRYSVALAPITDRVGVASLPGTQQDVQATSAPLTLMVEARADQRPISREIYGHSNVNDHALARETGITLSRGGGNVATRYNWKLGNAYNAARDYYFKNGNYGLVSPADRQPSGVADQGIAADRAAGITSLMTIPMIGWVARNDDNSAQSLNVPDDGGPPLTPKGDAIAGYDPTQNRQRTSTPSRARKGTPFSDQPDLSDPTVAQDEWVAHLVRRFGTAAQGGVRYYSMDNEPDLWFHTHTDIRPAQIGYDQMRDLFLQYATAVKDVDPTAQVTGPVVWHWRTLLYSPLDRGNDNYRSHPDHDAHGGVPFLAWWLQQIRRHDEATGRRSLDVLDYHIYPQGNVYSDDVSATMAALRLRSTRQLWDPSYVEESWIAERMRAIPRLREIVQANYPGTRVGLSEWNWGAEGAMNGALAVGSVLGIFGREGLDLACFWGQLTAGSPAQLAFKMFGNYDSAGNAFVGTSCRAHSSRDDLLTCFAAVPPGAGSLLMMVINLSPESDLTPTIQVGGLGAALGGATPRRLRSWRYWPDDLKHIVAGPDLDLTASATGGAALSFTYTFPAYSMTLLRLEGGA